MLKVLIADDERIVRKTLRLIGNWDEYEMEIVGEAQNGMEALEMIDQLKPDILLLDMKMPGLSGNQILEQLTGDRKRIHVIVISGYDDFEYARMALKYGAIDYLLKPINRNEFNQALNRIYENEQKLQIQGVERKKDALEQIKDKIDTNYMEDISLTNLAEAYFMNSDVLSRLFKKKYGVNITSYINDVRLTQAKIYLTAGYNSAQVSEMVGYHDSNYFSRVFKKYYGMSPTQFVDEMNHS